MAACRKVRPLLSIRSYISGRGRGGGQRVLRHFLDLISLFPTRCQSQPGRELMRNIGKTDLSHLFCCEICMLPKSSQPRGSHVTVQLEERHGFFLLLLLLFLLRKKFDLLLESLPILSYAFWLNSRKKAVGQKLASNDENVLFAHCEVERGGLTVWL